MTDMRFLGVRKSMNNYNKDTGRPTAMCYEEIERSNALKHLKRIISACNDYPANSSAILHTELLEILRMAEFAGGDVEVKFIEGLTPRMAAEEVCAGN